MLCVKLVLYEKQEGSKKEMLNKKQRKFLQEEMQELNQKEMWANDNGKYQKAVEYALYYWQTYKILDCLLEIEGKEIETI